MSMVHFVFEMQSVRVNNDNSRMQQYRVIKTTLIGILTMHVIIYDITRVVQESGHDIGKTGQIFVVFALVLKMVSDTCMFYFFIQAF